MGSVHAALDLRELRQVALKKIESPGGQPPRMLEERFQREIRALAGIRHPGVPTLYHSGRSPEGEAFYTMELVVGVRLRDLIVGGPLAPELALAIAVELGRALAAAHEAGVVHRDVKPANILVEPGGKIRLIDFGACALLPRFFSRQELDDGPVTATRDRWATGDWDAVATPGYSAPEVGRDDEEASPRADVYSLCAIVYEMLQGRPLFDREAHRLRTVEPDEFPPALTSLVPVLARGVSESPRGRPASMAELVRELEIVRAGVTRAATVSRGEVARGRAWWPSALLGALALGLLGLAWLRAGSADTTGSAVEGALASFAARVPDVRSAVVQAPTSAPATRPEVTAAPAPPMQAASTPTPAEKQIRRRSTRSAAPPRRDEVEGGTLEPTTVEARVGAAVRACGGGASLRVAVLVREGRAHALTIDLGRVDPADPVHRCVVDALASARFPATEAPVRLTIK
jgi:serine/threonine-protein kinase